MKSWNVIFLINQNPPTKIVFLKRGPNRSFAPNMYTGVGGKVEEGETLLESAYRELNEETGITTVKLQQFAKVIINQTDELIYFFGIFPYTPNLPDSNEGTLEWVKTEDIFQKDIIPTTKEMLKKWRKQNFSTQSFILNVKTINEENGIKKLK